MKVTTVKDNGNVMIEAEGIIKEYIPAERLLNDIDNAIAYNNRIKAMRIVITVAVVVISFLVGMAIG